MKPRPTLEITLRNRLTGEERTLRLLAKPCRNLRTRYWVVLPAQHSGRERWFMEPSVADAVQRACDWLQEQALAGFSNSVNLPSHQLFSPQPASPRSATPKSRAKPNNRTMPSPTSSAWATRMNPELTPVSSEPASSTSDKI